MERAWGNEYRTTTICIDSYRNGVPAGRLYSPYLEQGIRFESLTQLLLRMDDLLNEMNFPQAATAVRTFAAPPDENQPLSSHRTLRGETATFLLKVLFRQHTSWQGTVYWKEGMAGESFRSVLELIFLMDSALRGGGGSQERTA